MLNLLIILNIKSRKVTFHTNNYIYLTKRKFREGVRYCSCTKKEDYSRGPN